MCGSQQKHDSIQAQIYRQPQLAGLPPTYSKKQTEYALYRDGSMYVVPDIFLAYDRYNAFIEVKSSPNSKLYSKGMKQLERILNWHQERGYDEPHMRIVMPQKPHYKKIQDAARDLMWYQLGDTFSTPRYVESTIPKKSSRIGSPLLY